MNLMTVGGCHASASDVLAAFLFSAPSRATPESSHTGRNILLIGRHAPFLFKKPTRMSPVKQITLKRHQIPELANKANYEHMAILRPQRSGMAAKETEQEWTFLDVISREEGDIQKSTGGGHASRVVERCRPERSTGIKQGYWDKIRQTHTSPTVKNRSELSSVTTRFVRPL